jgi:hypothetical protein
MAKIPYEFYRKNMKTIYGLFGLILLINGTIGYFIKVYYNFPETESIEIVFFVSVLLHFAVVQLVFRKRMKEFKDTGKQEG